MVLITRQVSILAFPVILETLEFKHMVNNTWREQETNRIDIYCIIMLMTLHENSI